jgi:hypothetical protein
MAFGLLIWQIPERRRQGDASLSSFFLLSIDSCIIMIWLFTFVTFWPYNDVLLVFVELE